MALHIFSVEQFNQSSKIPYKCGQNNSQFGQSAIRSVPWVQENAIIFDLAAFDWWWLEPTTNCSCELRIGNCELFDDSS